MALSKGPQQLQATSRGVKYRFFNFIYLFIHFFALLWLNKLIAWDVVYEIAVVTFPLCLLCRTAAGDLTILALNWAGTRFRAAQRLP